jgi:hypothetical protein
VTATVAGPLEFPALCAAVAAAIARGGTGWTPSADVPAGDGPPPGVTSLLSSADVEIQGLLPGSGGQDVADASDVPEFRSLLADCLAAPRDEDDAAGKLRRMVDQLAEPVVVKSSETVDLAELAAGAARPRPRHRTAQRTGRPSPGSAARALGR